MVQNIRENARFLTASGYLTTDEARQIEEITVKASKRGAPETIDPIERIIREEYIEDSKHNPLRTNINDLGLEDKVRNVLTRRDLRNIDQVIFFEENLGDKVGAGRSLGPIQLPIVQDAIQAYLQHETYSGESAIKQQTIESIREYRALANPSVNKLAGILALKYAVTTIGDFMRQSSKVVVDPEYYGTDSRGVAKCPNPQKDFDSIIRGVNNLISRKVEERR